MSSSIRPAGPGTYSREAECGCWSEIVIAPEGELLEVHVQVCEAHMNIAYDELDLRVRSANSQLTLELPSRDGRPEG